MPQILYAHGFGVQKDDRGLFTDVAAALPSARHYLVDLNDVDPVTGNMHTPVMEEQARRLQIIHDQIAGGPDVVIAHSMGCLVAAMLSPLTTKRLIFLAPPTIFDLMNTLTAFQGRPGSVIDPGGTSILARKDGSLTTVPAEFWTSRKRNQPHDLYQRLQGRTVHVILAENDEVLAVHDAKIFPPWFTVQTLPGDHNFSGDACAALIAKVCHLI